MSARLESRALVLTPRLPWPLDDGGRIGLWQVLWSAAQAYRTTLVALHDDREKEAPAPEEVTRLGIQIVRVPHRPPPALRSVWRGIAGPWPYTIERYRNPELDRTIRSLVQAERPAFVLVNHLHLMPAVADLRDTPIVLREHNVEFSWMARYAGAHRGSLRGLYAASQISRLRRAEAWACAHAALVLAVQPEEAEILRALSPSARVEHLPIGIDLRRFREPSPADPPIVLIAGAFGWPPNAEGAVRFLRQGWERLRESLPTARLRVVGKDPPAELIEAGRRAGAEVVGYVPSMAEEFARASALVVPLWVGAGARVKIVEALAAGLPVVSTSLGAEGLDLVPERDYEAGETPEELARAVHRLLAAPEARLAMAARGRAIAEARWGLEGVAERQNQLCASVTGARRSESA